MLGISTCWWESRCSHGDEIINDAIKLGLDGIELDYRITSLLYRQMKPRLNKDLRVLSVHNYFPVPDEKLEEKPSGDIFLFSSQDREERSMAVKYTKRTIHHANDLEVAPVILHLGHVDMQNPMDGFKKLYRQGKIGSEEGRIFIDEQKNIRDGKRQKYLDSVLSCLEKLNYEAEKMGVILCIENRYYFHEIPSFDEVGLILKEFEGGSIRYWHDVGHAEVQDKLGISNKLDPLRVYSNDLAGVHIHDVKGLDDHFSPGEGDVDFNELKEFLKPSTVKILEIHYQRSTMDKIKEGIDLARDVILPA